MDPRWIAWVLTACFVTAMVTELIVVLRDKPSATLGRDPETKTKEYLRGCPLNANCKEHQHTP